MKTFLILLSIVILSSCASEKKQFDFRKTCSNESVKYLRNPRNLTKRDMQNPYLAEKIANTQRSMQLCYEDFKKRTDHEGEFNTCLVVGIDEYGSMDFYNFSSREAKLDNEFITCANAITARLDFASYGWNSILVQSYSFYYE